MKITVSGKVPFVGLAEKLATGTMAPLPITLLVTLPPLPETNTILVLKVPAVAGANCTTTLVVPKPPSVKLLPDGILNGWIVLTTPFVTVAPPRLVTTNVCNALDPTATQPKSQFVEVTRICPGVCPIPFTEFVKFVPLPEKTTFVTNVPSAVGVKLTTTLVAVKPSRLKAPPETMLKGEPTVAVQLLSAPFPVFVTTNVALALVPTITMPKFVPAGETAIFPGVNGTLTMTWSVCSVLNGVPFFTTLMVT